MSLARYWRAGSISLLSVVTPLVWLYLAGHEGGPAWGADGIRAERVLHEDALGGELVDNRRRIERGQPSAVGPDSVGGVVVGHDEENVRLLRRDG